MTFAAGTEASYAACRQMVRRSGSNFYPCFLLLSGEQRRGMEALYAYLRLIDDVGDGQLPIDQRREELGRWRQAVCAAARGASLHNAPQEGQAALPALGDTVRRFAIPVEHLTAVIDGVEMDLNTTRYATYDELVVYLDRVASAVGLACLPIWGLRSPAGATALQAARSCGRAFQLTNIVRDLAEDFALGRCYLPLEDLASAGYSLEHLAAGTTNAAFDRLMQFEAARIDHLFDEARDLFDALSPAGQRVLGLMTSIYSALAKKVFARSRQLFDGRIRLSRATKLGLALRWWLLPARKGSLP